MVLENYKNNPTGKVIQQEQLLSLIKKYKFQVETLKQQIIRLEKDNLRYKQDIKHVTDQNSEIKGQLELVSKLHSRSRGSKSVLGNCKVFS